METGAETDVTVTDVDVAATVVITAVEREEAEIFDPGAEDAVTARDWEEESAEVDFPSRDTEVPTLAVTAAADEVELATTVVVVDEGRRAWSAVETATLSDDDTAG